ncbi:MAG: ethanolamine ammonia-lyase reactivating factor EutA [Desulfobacterales bacterium]|nr:ethanolamine ammonia-lyase reactivating factor EutA [Desulfobacterales bacterium]
MKESVLSVGIDIGTSTTQLVFSRISIENTASMISVPRISIVDKEVIYRSGIHFTPLRSPVEIDGNRVREIIEGEYRKAGVAPEDAQTGAVIITGETARKENAAEVLSTLSHLAGEFVVATAGPALEGIIAGKGANAAQESKERGAVIANLDIGGGTTNIAVFRNGDVIDTACLDIGGRLITFDDKNGTISWVSDKMKQLGDRMGIALAPGKSLSVKEIQTLTSRMAGILDEVIGLAPASSELELMVTDHDLRRDYPVDYVTFSGGVADCIKTPGDVDAFSYGDIGIFLGRSIAASGLGLSNKTLHSTETIRATVVGAGSHTTDISGSTITVAADALPLKNVPVLKLSREEEATPFADWGELIRSKVEWFKLDTENQQLALAFEGPDNISFSDLQLLADKIIEGTERLAQKPLIVVVEKDFSKALGQTLRVKLKSQRDVICIDTVKVENGDYIDIGRELPQSRVVPVIVKTLLFNY